MKNNKKQFENLFDEVWVINLKRRPDRLIQFWKEIERVQWPFASPRVFPAIDGSKLKLPKYWGTGAGSYGCLRSHMTILEQAIMKELSSLLILEDDVVFADSIHEDLSDFFFKVPDDWECIMFGGEYYRSRPIPVTPGVTRSGPPGGIQRTHCYGIRGEKVIQSLYQSWANSAVHCDWIMGPLLTRFNTYAPDPFLAGQRSGKSDVSRVYINVDFWRPTDVYKPVIILRAPLSVARALNNLGWYIGAAPDPETGIDTGLQELFSDTTLSKQQRELRLKDWIIMSQHEITTSNLRAICTLWHPNVKFDSVKKLVKGVVLEINADDVEEATEKLRRSALMFQT